MKRIILSGLLSLLLSSCSRNDDDNQPAPSNEIVTVLEIKSTAPQPANVTRMRLTELLTNAYVEKVFNPGTPDTVKATLSLPFRYVPNQFDAQVSVYFQDGTIRNTTIPGVTLLKGKKNTYIGNFFAAGFNVEFDDELKEGETIPFTF